MVFSFLMSPGPFQAANQHTAPATSDRTITGTPVVMSTPVKPNTIWPTAFATIMQRMMSQAMTKTDIRIRKTFVPLPPSTPRTPV